MTSIQAQNRGRRPTVGSTRTPTRAMPSAFLWPLLLPYALRAPAPVNLGVRPQIHTPCDVLRRTSLLCCWALSSEGSSSRSQSNGPSWPSRAAMKSVSSQRILQVFWALWAYSMRQRCCRSMRHSPRSALRFGIPSPKVVFISSSFRSEMFATYSN